MRTLEQYADVIVLRHPQIGAAKMAAEAATVPVINAGDGAGEHPTQALLDLFTIQEELGTLDGLTVSMVGDLRFGRTVHSLSKLLSMYNVKLNLVSPEMLRLPLTIMNQVRETGIEVSETHDVADIIADTDVLYVTRVQKERFSDLGEYEQVKDMYEITTDLLTHAKEKMVVLHPLPRVGEIHYDVDKDPRAAYFRQVRNGMYIRMALLAGVLGRA
jgi:carbamoyl-phosphate synthase/aspartate carbamoyltransferase/dihydroorotase/carbamoyl-phosphate synthase/aspartate carbamoyltransferase